jgi:hypothetical protein
LALDSNNVHGATTMPKSSRPNFRVIVWVPRYDDRDAYCGAKGHLVAVAETAAWAHRLCAIENASEAMEWSEAWAEVVDQRGLRVFRPAPAVAAAEVPFDEIPF